MASSPRNSGRGASPAVSCVLCTAQGTASRSLLGESCWLPPLPDPLPVTDALGVEPLLKRPGLPCRTRGPAALGREAGERSGSPDPTPTGQGWGEGVRR